MKPDLVSSRTGAFTTDGSDCTRICLTHGLLLSCFFTELRQARHAYNAFHSPTAGMFVALPPGASASGTKINKSLGQESFRKIRDARQSLDNVDAQLRVRKFEEVTVSTCACRAHVALCVIQAQY